MLTEVEVFNELGSMLSLPMDSSSEFVIKDIDGLGPVKTELASSQFADMPGGVVSNKRTAMRNIVIQIGYNVTSQGPSNPITRLRRLLYNYFTPEMVVDLLFKSDDFETVRIQGIVESMEPSIFSAEPVLTISILCEYPFFQSLIPTTVSRNGTGFLETPYAGTVPTGFVLLLENVYSFAAGGLNLHNLSSNIRMRYQGPLKLPNETPMNIRIDTTRGQKSAVYLPTSEYNPANPTAGTNALGDMINWLDIRRGRTLFSLNMIGQAVNTPLKVSMTYTTKYVGL